MPTEVYATKTGLSSRAAHLRPALEQMQLGEASAFLRLHAAFVVGHLQIWFGSRVALA